MEYKIPDEYFFRIHHVRPRFKGDIENVLIYMAEEISAVGELPVDEFISNVNAAIYRYPGNAHRELKTINNWRTEISTLFGFIEHSNGTDKSGRRALELAANQKGGNSIGLTKSEVCHCVFNDLRVTRDNESVEKTWERIRNNRINRIEYDQTGDVIRYAGDIVDYMEIANLLKTYDSHTYYLNVLEEEAIIKFVESSEWFSEYDEMIENRSGTMGNVKGYWGHWRKSGTWS